MRAPRSLLHTTQGITCARHTLPKSSRQRYSYDHRLRKCQVGGILARSARGERTRAVRTTLDCVTAWAFRSQDVSLPGDATLEHREQGARVGQSLSEKGHAVRHHLDCLRPWDALTAEQKRAYVDRIDLRTDEGMRLVFHSEYLPTKHWWQTMEGNEFFRAAAVFLKMVNVGMSMGNMAGAWTAKGFGLWSHIVPDVGLSLVEEAMARMSKLGLKPGLPDHFPHPIYKPPGGDPLGIHKERPQMSNSGSSLGRNLIFFRGSVFLVYMSRAVKGNVTRLGGKRDNEAGWIVLQFVLFRCTTAFKLYIYSTISADWNRGPPIPRAVPRRHAGVPTGSPPDGIDRWEGARLHGSH